MKRDFSLNEDQLRKVFLLSHMVCSKAYVKAFQYKVLNSILHTNTKLHKTGYITDDKCSFYNSEPETLLRYVHTFVTLAIFAIFVNGFVIIVSAIISVARTAKIIY